MTIKIGISFLGIFGLLSVLAVPGAAKPVQKKFDCSRVCGRVRHIQPRQFRGCLEKINLTLVQMESIFEMLSIRARAVEKELKEIQSDAEAEPQNTPHLFILSNNLAVALQWTEDLANAIQSLARMDPHFPVWEKPRWQCRALRLGVRSMSVQVQMLTNRLDAIAMIRTTKYIPLDASSRALYDQLQRMRLNLMWQMTSLLSNAEAVSAGINP